jgi:hypothetical protein
MQVTVWLTSCCGLINPWNSFHMRLGRPDIQSWYSKKEFAFSVRNRTTVIQSTPRHFIHWAISAYGRIRATRFFEWRKRSQGKLQLLPIHLTAWNNNAPSVAIAHSSVFKYCFIKNSPIFGVVWQIWIFVCVCDGHCSYVLPNNNCLWLLQTWKFCI